MAHGIQLGEYLDNIKALLRGDESRWRIVVERQVQTRVLPNVVGARVDIEPLLFALLILCLDGHQAEIPELTDETWETARDAARSERSMSGEAAAVFPRAAVAVALVITEVREAGVYPPPKI